MAEDDPDELAWKEHGHFEVTVPVWNPNEGKNEQSIDYLTLGIVADEERLNGVTPGLADALDSHGAAGVDEASDIEAYVNKTFAGCFDGASSGTRDARGSASRTRRRWRADWTTRTSRSSLCSRASP